MILFGIDKSSFEEIDKEIVSNIKEGLVDYYKFKSFKGNNKPTKTGYKFDYYLEVDASNMIEASRIIILELGKDLYDKLIYCDQEDIETFDYNVNDNYWKYNI